MVSASCNQVIPVDTRSFFDVGATRDVRLAAQATAGVYYCRGAHGEGDCGDRHDHLSSANLSAVADPTFTIDPSFAEADAFTIEYSPGVVLEAVPEPNMIFPIAVVLLIIGRRRGSAFPRQVYPTTNPTYCLGKPDTSLWRT